MIGALHWYVLVTAWSTKTPYHHLQSSGIHPWYPNNSCCANSVLPTNKLPGEPKIILKEGKKSMSFSKQIQQTLSFRESAKKGCLGCARTAWRASSASCAATWSPRRRPASAPTRQFSGSSIFSSPPPSQTGKKQDIKQRRRRFTFSPGSSRNCATQTRACQR